MKDRVTDLLSRDFLRLLSDYGFKRVFGLPENSHILIRFLNALFEGRMVITDVKYHPKDVLPPDEDGKPILYDIYCTTATGHHFIVEMQQQQSELFGKRMLFYMAAAIYRQGERGRSYNFDPVYLVAVTDFDIRPLKPQLVNEVILKERVTDIVFTEEIKIFYLSLHQVSEKWEDCTTELERLLYLIKNMDKLDKKSAPYVEGGFEEIFRASEIASMANEDVVTYKQSLLREMETESAIEFAKHEGYELGERRGREEGIRRGREEGREESLKKVAKEMKKGGMPLAEIMLYTGLSMEDIAEL